MYSSWWLQCTNLQSLPKQANGVAIAVVSNHLETRAVELGAVVKHTSYHMVYGLYQNGMRGTRTTKDKLSTGRLPRLFYVPYLNIGLDPPAVRFALLELHSLRLLLSRTHTEEEHDRFLSNNSKTFVTFATINMSQHPSGFRICVLHGEDSSKAKQDYADAPVYSNTHLAIHVISLQDYPPIQKQTSHLNWLCLFRSYPCARDSLLELDQADRMLHSFKKGFGSRKRTLTLGQNLYFGKRSGQLPITATPTIGPGEGGEHQYHREFYNPVFTYPIEKLTKNQLAVLTMLYMNMMDPAIVNVLELNKRNGDDRFCWLKYSHSRRYRTSCSEFCTRRESNRGSESAGHIPAATTILFRFCLHASCGSALTFMVIRLCIAPLLPLQ
jgi:hypothetical protein